jgi:predicted SprT family Zn-dependent metalloprotease
MGAKVVGNRSRGRNKRTRSCECTKCGTKSERTRYELRVLAGGVRCDQCGGNVVEKRFAN